MVPAVLPEQYRQACLLDSCPSQNLDLNLIIFLLYPSFSLALFASRGEWLQDATTQAPAEMVGTRNLRGRRRPR